jgi:hypothetical protein
MLPSTVSAKSNLTQPEPFARAGSPQPPTSAGLRPLLLSHDFPSSRFSYQQLSRRRGELIEPEGLRKDGRRADPPITTAAFLPVSRSSGR